MNMYELVYDVQDIYIRKTNRGSSQKQSQNHSVRRAYQFVSVVATPECAVNRFSSSKLIGAVSMQKVHLQIVLNLKHYFVLSSL